MTSSRLIGRAGELAELEAALADAAGGRPSLAFLAGDSGVGKSRLLAALHERADEQGARMLVGDCVELGDGELPYAPIVAALRPLARTGDPVLDGLQSADRAALARILPGLGDASALALPADASAQAQLFEALLALLEALGREAPVVLALEDLHWADRSTRSFVAFLARALCTERVLVVATYRSDELHRRHPLRPLLAEIERDVRARRIELAPLTREEVADQLEDILGAAPDRDLGERLWSRGGGNPLFTEELLAAGLDGRGAPPVDAARGADAARRAPARRDPGAAAAARRRAARSITGCSPRRAASSSATCARRCARRSPGTSSSPTTTAATRSATRSCARSSSTTCSRARRPSCTACSPPRSSAGSPPRATART